MIEPRNLARMQRRIPEPDGYKLRSFGDLNNLGQVDTRLTLVTGLVTSFLKCGQSLNTQASPFFPHLLEGFQLAGRNGTRIKSTIRIGHQVQ